MKHPLIYTTMTIAALLALMPPLAYAGDLTALFSRAAQAVKAIDQVETTTDITFSLVSEDYKKKYGIEKYYEIIFNLNNGRCPTCNREYEEDNNATN